MKTKTLILTLLVPFALYLTPLVFPAQWTQQNSGIDLDLVSIYFTDNENGWAVGSEGIILHTDDGGDNWNEQPSGTSYDLESVSFLDPLNGWIAGGLWDNPQTGIILRTNNGGSSWEEMYIDTAFYLNDICFADSLNGWAVGKRSVWWGRYGTILHSNDGGLTWNRQEPLNFWSHLQSVYFTDPDTGWVVGGSRSYVYPINEPFCCILKTTNGGITWKEQIYGVGIYSKLQSVCFTDTENGWAVGNTSYSSQSQFPNLLRTGNGGAQWDSVLYNGSYYSDYSLESVCFINTNTGWVVGGYQDFSDMHNPQSIILHTQDGGDSWTEQAAGTELRLNSVCFVNAEEGWIAADGGIILHTDNGGIVLIPNGQKPQSTIYLHSYPNPFFISTTIEFELRQPGKAEIKIYNQTGQIVEEFVNEKSQTGINKFFWQADGQSPGIYFIRLQISKKIITKKIIKF